MKFFESVSRAPGSASATDRFVALRRFFDNRTKLFFTLRHAISSHEHITLSSRISSVAAVYDRRHFNRREVCDAHRAPLQSDDSGGVVEWLMAPVLKTGRAQALVGSNPTPSAV